MSEHTAPEPTMEEILASIRRIISEDDSPAPAAQASQPAEESWEPAEMAAPAGAVTVAEEAVVAHVESAPEPQAAPAAEVAREVSGDLDVFAARRAAAPEPEPPMAATPAPHPVAEPEPVAPVAAPILARRPVVATESALMDAEAASRVASAFDRLAAAAAPPPPRTLAPAQGVSSGAKSVEDLARELLAPMIKTWLDDNLPAIVQARVDEEVARIVRGRVG